MSIISAGTTTTTALINTGDTTGNLILQTNGTTTAMTLDTNGNVYGASGATTMTNGFFYIPSAGGAPTGVPTAVTGHVPMYYDLTNNQFYVYNGAWKKIGLA